MQNYYLVNKNELYEEGIGAEALMIKIALALNELSSKRCCINNAYLEAITIGVEDVTRTAVESVNVGFQELIERQEITIVQNLRNYSYICDIGNFYAHQDKSFFVKITFQEYKTIMSVKEDVSKAKLLKYFLELVGTFGASYKLDEKYRYRLGSNALYQLSTLTKISPKTMQRYNKILEDHKLIYILRRKAHTKINVDSGQIYSQLPNLYCRYEDKDICHQYASERGYRQHELMFINGVNEMRSWAQQYNMFVKQYSKTPCQDLNKVYKAYEAAKKWNTYTKEDFERKAADDSKTPAPKYKDMSIFDQYDLSSFNGEN